MWILNCCCCVEEFSLNRKFSIPDKIMDINLDISFIQAWQFSTSASATCWFIVFMWFLVWLWIRVKNNSWKIVSSIVIIFSLCSFIFVYLSQPGLVVLLSIALVWLLVARRLMKWPEIKDVPVFWRDLISLSVFCLVFSSAWIWYYKDELVLSFMISFGWIILLVKVYKNRNSEKFLIFWKTFKHIVICGCLFSSISIISSFLVFWFEAQK